MRPPDMDVRSIAYAGAALIAALLAVAVSRLTAHTVAGWLGLWALSALGWLIVLLMITLLWRRAWRLGHTTAHTEAVATVGDIGTILDYRGVKWQLQTIQHHIGTWSGGDSLTAEYSRHIETKDTP